MKGYNSIGEHGQKLFDRVHGKHLASMGADARQQYTKDKVRSIKANNAEQCLEVRFKNGEFFKYFTDETWG